MRRVRLIFLVMAALLPIAGAAERSSFSKPADVAAIAGSGRLTIGVNRSGRLVTCRWPSPGFFEHIEYETQSRTEPLLGVAPWDGAAWALKLDEQLVWMYDDRWSHRIAPDSAPRMISIDSTFAGRDLRVRQDFVVTPSGSEFQARIHVEGDVEIPPTAFWYANFSPSTSQIPHLPAVPRNARDFAAHVDGAREMIVHFRPRDPASYDWRAARRLLKEEEPGGWGAFSEGAYIAYGSTNRVLEMTAGDARAASGVANQVSAGQLALTGGSVGETASAIALATQSDETGYFAVVHVVFGVTHAEAAQRLQDVRLESDLRMPRVDFTADSNFDRIMRDAMAAIRTCTDAQTGSVIGAPSNASSSALDWPRYGAWIARAYDAAEQPERAAALLAFYANHVRASDSDTAPKGTLPAALYTNGVEAVPRAIVDAAAVGRVLWAIERHGPTLGVEGMAAFYRSVWPSVNAMADFLVLWREPGGTAPLYTFDYETKRDRRTTELYVASYLGVKSAARIADQLSDPRPEWRQAASELRDALRRHALHPTGDVAIDDPGALYGAEVVPRADYLDWPAFISGLLRETGGRMDTDGLERLCKLVLSARDIPEALRTEIASEVRRHMQREAPDAAEAAFAYLIAHKLRQIEVSPPTPISELSPETL